MLVLSVIHILEMKTLGPSSDLGRPAGCLASAHYACPLCRREQVARDSEVHEFTC